MMHESEHNTHERQADKCRDTETEIWRYTEIDYERDGESKTRAERERERESEMAG